MKTVEIKGFWDDDTAIWRVYVDGKMHTAHYTYEEAEEEANRIKAEQEDTDMTDSKAITFEVNGTTYNSNEKGNRFYKTIGTQKVRIGEAEWNEAFDAYTSNIEPPAVDEWEAEADAERQARYDKMAEDALKAAEALNPKEVVKTANETIKKTKKKSKKNVAFTFEDADGIVTLTEKQVRFLTLLPNDDFYENGLDSSLWIDVLCDTLANEFNPMALGAMVSTLREKYLISVGVQKVNGKKCKFFSFTELGKRVARELGLN